MNKAVTAFSIVAVLVAAAIVASTMVTDQAFAHRRHHSGSCNNGSTCVSQSNSATNTASGSGSVTNRQVNVVRF